MDRFYAASFSPLTREDRRAARRRYAPVRRKWLPEVRRIVLDETRLDRPSPLLKEISRGSLVELCTFLDCVPHLRYVVTLERRTAKGPEILVDVRGKLARLSRMVRRVLGDDVGPSEFPRDAASDRSRRRQLRILTAVDALIDGLDARTDLKFLIAWQVEGTTTPDVDSSHDWTAEAQIETLRGFLACGFTGLLLPPAAVPAFLGRIA